jgi:hypothetical protein
MILSAQASLLPRVPPLSSILSPLFSLVGSFSLVDGEKPIFLVVGGMFFSGPIVRSSLNLLVVICDYLFFFLNKK